MPSTPPVGTCSRMFTLNTPPPSTLLWADKKIQSAKGCNRGIHLGPCSSTLPSLNYVQGQLNSELQMFYPNDGTLRSSIEDHKHDLQVVENVGAEIGLQLKEEKTEIAAPTSRIPPAFSTGGMHSGPQKATLLGSPNGKATSVSNTVSDNTSALKTGLCICTHDASYV